MKATHLTILHKILHKYDQFSTMLYLIGGGTLSPSFAIKLHTSINSCSKRKLGGTLVIELINVLILYGLFDS